MKENTFKVRARLIEQLGEQLIKNESIALIELIKNADASEEKKKENRRSIWTYLMNKLNLKKKRWR